MTDGQVYALIVGSLYVGAIVAYLAAHEAGHRLARRRMRRTVADVLSEAERAVRGAS